LSCTEISDDPALVVRLKKLYDTLDVGTTPMTVLVPWLPTPAMINKFWATKEIYDIVIKAIKNREKSGISQGDTLQMLLDNGDEEPVIVGVSFFKKTSLIYSHSLLLTDQFIMGLLIAGARATGTTGKHLP
jgi:hypothetical protein